MADTLTPAQIVAEPEVISVLAEAPVNLGGSGGAVDSVNGQTGDVVLTSADVGGALATHDASLALGFTSKTSRAGELSVGGGSGTYATRYIANVKDPVNDQDAATKHYVDELVANIGGGITLLETSASRLDVSSLEKGIYRINNTGAGALTIAYGSTALLGNQYSGRDIYVVVTTSGTSPSGLVFSTTGTSAGMTIVGYQYFSSTSNLVVSQFVNKTQFDALEARVAALEGNA